MASCSRSSSTTKVSRPTPGCSAPLRRRPGSRWNRRLAATVQGQLAEVRASARGSSRRRTPSVNGSSATCTTARSSGSSRSRCGSGCSQRTQRPRRGACRRRRRDELDEALAELRTSHGASIPRRSSRAGSPRPWRRSPSARPSRSAWTSPRAAGLRVSRWPPTSSSPRPSRTRSDTLEPPMPRCPRASSTDGSASRSATTVSVVPTREPGRVLAGSPTGWRPSAAPSRSSARLAGAR